MPSENELDTATRLATLEAQTAQHDKALASMSTDIKDIKDNLLQRPSWAVSIIITILTTLCVGLSVYVATTLQSTRKSLSSIIQTL